MQTSRCEEFCAPEFLGQSSTQCAKRSQFTPYFGGVQLFAFKATAGFGYRPGVIQTASQLLAKCLLFGRKVKIHRLPLTSKATFSTQR